MLTSQFSNVYTTFNSFISSQTSGVEKKRINFEAILETDTHYHTCICTQTSDCYLGMQLSLMILALLRTIYTGKFQQVKNNNTAVGRKQDTIRGCISFSSWQVSEVQQSGLDVYMKPFHLRKKSLENKSKEQALQSTDQAWNLPCPDCRVI